MSSITAEPGDVVTLSMQLPQATVAQAGGIAVSYDEQFLQLESGRWKLEDTMVAPFFKDTALGAFAYTFETSISGEIFTVSFKVRDDAPAGTAVVAMVLELRNGKNETISSVNNGATITVKRADATTAPVVTTVPVVTTAPVVTTEPIATTAPVVTTVPVVTAEPAATTAPVETTVAIEPVVVPDTTAQDTTTDDEQSGGCGALIALPILVVSTASGVTVIKKGKRQQ